MISTIPRPIYWRRPTPDCAMKRTWKFGRASVSTWAASFWATVRGKCGDRKYRFCSWAKSNQHEPSNIFFYFGEQVCCEFNVRPFALRHRAARESTTAAKLHCAKFMREWTLGQGGSDIGDAIHAHARPPVLRSNFSYRKRLLDIGERTAFRKIRAPCPLSPSHLSASHWRCIRCAAAAIACARVSRKNSTIEHIHHSSGGRTRWSSIYRYRFPSGKLYVNHLVSSQLESFETLSFPVSSWRICHSMGNYRKLLEKEVVWTFSRASRYCRTPSTVRIVSMYLKRGNALWAISRIRVHWPSVCRRKMTVANPCWQLHFANF